MCFCPNHNDAYRYRSGYDFNTILIFATDTHVTSKVWLNMTVSFSQKSVRSLFVLKTNVYNI